MKKIKVYVLLDKKTNDLISYMNGNEVVFSTKKKNLLVEFGSKVKQAILEIKFKGIDY